MYDFIDPVALMKKTLDKIFASLPQPRTQGMGADPAAGSTPTTEDAGVRPPPPLEAIESAVGHWAEGQAPLAAGPVQAAPEPAPAAPATQPDGPVDAAPRAAPPRSKAEEQAIALGQACAGKDPAAFQKALAGKSPEELAALRQAYELAHPGADFHADMKDAEGKLGVKAGAIDAALDKDRAATVAKAAEALAPGAKPEAIKDTLRHLPPDKRQEVLDALPEEARLVAGAFLPLVDLENNLMAEARKKIEAQGPDAGDEAMRQALRLVPEERRGDFLAGVSEAKRDATGKGLERLEDEDDRLDRNVQWFLDPSGMAVELGEKNAPKGLFDGVPRDRWEQVIDRLPADDVAKAREQIARIEESERKDVAVQNGVMGVLKGATAKGPAGAAAVAAAIDQIPPDRRDDALAALAAMDPTGAARQQAEDALAARQRKLAGASEALFKASVVADGTDEKTIRRTLLGLSPAEAEEIKAIYKEAHGGRSLEEDLLNDLDSSSERLDADYVRAKLSGKEMESKAVMLQIGAKDDNDLIFEILEGVAEDPAQRAVLEEQFKARQAADEDAVDDGLLTIDDMLKDELGDEKLERAQALREGRVAEAYAIAAEDAMEGGGTDEEGVNHAVGRCPLALRADMAEVYAARNPGKQLLTEMSSEIEDEAERNIALGLFKNQEDRVLAGQMKKDGVDAILAQCQGKSGAELEAARARFNADYAKDYQDDEDKPDGKTPFDRFLADEADDKVELAAVQQMTEKGAIEPALQVLYGGYGMGTTEDMMKSALQDPKTGRPRTREEMDAMRARFKDLGAELGVDVPAMDEYYASELGGRDAFDAGQDLRGAPTTVQDKVARVKAKHAFERQGAFVGLADMMAPSAENAEQLQYNALTYLGQKIESGEATPEDEAEFERRYDYYQGNVASYRAGKDTVTTYLSTGATAVVGAVTTALSAGSLGPAWAGVVGALAGGESGMLMNTGINGSAVSSSELAASVFQTLGSAATAGILKIPGVGKFFEGLIENGVAREGVMKALGALANGGMGLATNEQLMDGKLNLGDVLGKLAAATGGGFLEGAGGKLVSGLLSSVGIAAAQLGQGGATQLEHFLNSGLSGVAGEVLAGVVDPEMWKGEYGGKWLQKLMTSGVTQLIGAYGSWNDFQKGVKGYAKQLGIPEEEMWQPHNQERITEQHKVVTAAKELGISEAQMDTEENKERIGRYRMKQAMDAEAKRNEDWLHSAEARQRREADEMARLRAMDET